MGVERRRGVDLGGADCRGQGGGGTFCHPGRLVRNRVRGDLRTGFMVAQADQRSYYEILPAISF